MKVTHLVMGCEEANALGVDLMRHGDPSCTVILIEQDGIITSTSHAPSDVEPAGRFNRTYPDGEDWRGAEEYLSSEATDEGLVVRRAREPKEMRAQAQA